MAMVKITDGSEKQNAWAERIRGEFISNLDTQMRHAQEQVARTPHDDSYVWIVFKLAIASRLIPTQTSARWWIDHRDFGKTVAGLLSTLSASEITEEARRVYEENKAKSLASGESEDEADKSARGDASRAVATIASLDRGGRFDRKMLTFIL